MTSLDDPIPKSPAQGRASLHYPADDAVSLAPPPREETKEWNTCCSKSSKSCIQFSVQVSAAFIVLLAAMYQVSSNAPARDLWVSLLSSSLGFLMPNPKLG